LLPSAPCRFRCKEREAAKDFCFPEYSGFYGSSTAPAFSPDGHQIVDVDAGSAHLGDGHWQASQTAPYQGGIHTLSFSRDGKWLVVGTCDHAASVWNTGTWSLAREFKIEQQCVQSADFTPDASQVVMTVGTYASPNSNIVYLWDLLTGNQVCQLHLAKAAESAIFMPAGTMMTSSTDGLTLSWDEAGVASLFTDGLSERTRSWKTSPRTGASRRRNGHTIRRGGRTGWRQSALEISHLGKNELSNSSELRIVRCWFPK
jgi:WD40 repeat protein